MLSRIYFETAMAACRTSVCHPSEDAQVAGDCGLFFIYLIF